MMKGKHNGGFSLVEVLVSITLMASIVVPVCTSMLVAPRVNAKAEAMLEAKIAVSSAVETLMAEGIDPDDLATIPERFEGVTIELKNDHANDTYYNVVVSTDLVTVETSIREVGGSNE